MSDIARWTCPACKKSVLTAYCAQCGEEPHVPHELTFRSVAEKLVHALTSIDARALRTAWCLLRHPGRLTLAWAAGMRKPYVAPFQLFLLANVLFFALQWLADMNIFSSTLESHLHHQHWSNLATSLVARRLDKTGMALERFAPVFDRAVVINAKSLIVLMTVPFAALLPLIFYRAHRALMVHVVFSLHHYTFLLLLFCAALLGVRRVPLRRDRPGLQHERRDAGGPGVGPDACGGADRHRLPLHPVPDHALWRLTDSGARAAAGRPGLASTRRVVRRLRPHRQARPPRRAQRLGQLREFA